MTENDTLDIFNAFERKLGYMKHDLKQTLKYFSVLEKQPKTAEFHNCEGNYASDDFQI
jgi:hypothetical protein